MSWLFVMLLRCCSSEILACSVRLVPTMRRRERILSTLAILGSIIGGAGLILLSVFDTKRHHSLHRIFLLVFIIGVALSAIFTIAEVREQSMTCFEDLITNVCHLPSKVPFYKPGLRGDPHSKMRIYREGGDCRRPHFTGSRVCRCALHCRERRR